MGTLEHRIEQYMVDCPRARIAVMAEGSGPLVVMLPSLGRDSDDFGEVSAGIAAAGYRVLRPAPRGLRGSTGAMDGITLHDLAEDVAAVIEHAGGGPAVIAGHAFGNWVARCTGADRPDLVRAVILMAAGQKGMTTPPIREAITTSFTTSLPREQRLAALKFAFFAPGNDPSAWLEGWSKEVALAQRAATAATPMEDYWPGGTRPILDLQAECDVLAPRAGMNKLVEELGNRVTIAVVLNAGHALIPEQPALVVEEVLRYLKVQGH